jgi:hypothetical protein
MMPLRLPTHSPTTRRTQTQHLAPWSAIQMGNRVFQVTVLLTAQVQRVQHLDLVEWDIIPRMVVITTPCIPIPTQGPRHTLHLDHHLPATNLRTRTLLHQTTLCTPTLSHTRYIRITTEICFGESEYRSLALRRYCNG